MGDAVDAAAAPAGDRGARSVGRPVGQLALQPLGVGEIDCSAGIWTLTNALDMKRFKKLLVHLDLEGPHDGAAIRYASAVSRLSSSRRIEFVHTGPATTLFPSLSDDSPARVAHWLPQAHGEVEALVRRHFRSPRECRVRLYPSCPSRCYGST